MQVAIVVYGYPPGIGATGTRVSGFRVISEFCGFVGVSGNLGASDLEPKLSTIPQRVEASSSFALLLNSERNALNSQTPSYDR